MIEKNITKYWRKTYLLTSSIALHVFDQMKFNQLQGFPAMCQITSLGLILLICLLVKEILKLYVHKKKYTSKKPHLGSGMIALWYWNLEWQKQEKHI